jgi:DNA-binding winged helix-turn-helix (wHTH) protein/tetratricopeptide (TPR) repeat protein
VSGLLRFGEFEFHAASGELFRRGRRVALQPQPAKLLALLAGRAGELVTREEIRAALWGDDLHVEVDQGINFCVRQLRFALGDPGERPVWIETLPRRGYRFRGPLAPSAATSEAPGAEPVPEPERGAPRRIARWALPSAAVLLVAAGWLAVAAAKPRANATPSPTMPAAAREAYVRGIYFAKRDGREVVERGLAELRRAALLAPASPEPLVALAEGLLSLHRYRREPALLEEAALLAERAVDLGPGLAAAHLARAQARLRASYDWSAAENEFRRSIELDPRLAAAHRGYASLLAASGRLDDAVVAARRARELDPVCLAASADLGWYLFLAGRNEESVAASRDALALDPASTAAHLNILYARLQQGDEAAALEQANAHLAAYFGRIGRPAPRAATLEQYWRGFIDHLGEPGSDAAAADLALPHLGLDDDGEALRLLLSGCHERAGRDPIFAAVNPLLRRLRDDPRLREVVTCVGLDPDALLSPASARPPAVPAHGVETVRG